MATLKEIELLKKEVAAAKQVEETDLQAKIASLSTIQIGELIHLKEYWTQEVKNHRALDQETIARRIQAELWLKAIAFVAPHSGLDSGGSQGSKRSTESFRSSTARCA